MYAQGYRLKLCSHLVELSDVPSCSYQIFGLDLACAYLTVFGTLLDVLDQFLFLILELDPLSVKFPLRLFECSLVLPETFGWGHALPERPFYDLESSKIEALWNACRL